MPNALSDARQLEPFAQVELVVLDLDGTFLKDLDDLPATAEWGKRSHLVNRLKSRGVPLTLATGRAVSGARAVMDAVSRHKDTPFIFYNGSVVMTAAGIVLDQRNIGAEVLQQVTNIVDRVGASCLSYWIQLGIAGQMEGEWAVYAGNGSPPQREFNGLPVFPLDHPVPQAATCVAALLWADEPRVRATLVEAIASIPEISTTVSGLRYLEVRPLGSSKAVGLEVALRHLGISRDRVMAIGDNDNDVELLEAVGLSVCVANASSRAQECSRFQTTYPSSSGVIEALQLVTQARRLWPGPSRRQRQGNG